MESKVTGEVTLGVVVDEAKCLADKLWPDRERYLEQLEFMEAMFAGMDDQLYGDCSDEEGLRAYF
ncbi:Hypothetical predicted protein [Lecanosticta acicola]|uniref:Uncharacterized protein n=1 Tax=Lecanosticta acicola TaxID=111012 RepID=A0AAI9E8R5_9PEZI|nr:Hypothetical predicted protein [Lecanosticta acicola]